MVPHSIIGPVVIAVAIFWGTVLLAGSTVSGTITDMHTTHDSEDGTSYDLTYDYTFNNRKYHATGRTNKSTYAALKPGDHVSAKVLPSLPNFGTQLLDGNAPWPGILFMAAFGAAWTTLMLVLIKHVYIDPHIRNNVMKNGKVCLGKITDKSISGEDHDVYTLSFQYEPSPGRYRTDSVSVSETNFNNAKLLEDVTVLYDLDHLSQSMLYRYSDYELIP